VWRNRIVSAAAVAALLALLRGVAPEDRPHEAALALLALPLGYGHLLGGLWFARRRLAGLLPGRVPRGAAAALALSSLLNLLALYGAALRSAALAPWLLGILLLASLWHIVENDLALARAGRAGVALGALAHRPRDAARALALSASLGLAALATPEGVAYSASWLGVTPALRAPFGLEQLASAVLLYHAATWLLFSWQRAGRLARVDGAGARRRRRDLVLVHALPCAGGALLYCFAPSAHAAFAAPGLYLFFSVLHAFQTALARSARARRAAWAAA
jgi:hypothetical protein